MNQAIFMGRLCRDPQTRSYAVKEGGKKVEKEMGRDRHYKEIIEDIINNIREN